MAQTLRVNCLSFDVALLTFDNESGTCFGASIGETFVLATFIPSNFANSQGVDGSLRSNIEMVI
jgi:hypothetical protein